MYLILCFQVEPYHSGMCSLGHIDKCSPLKAAILEAEGLVEASGTDRLNTCRYVRLNGTVRPKKAVKKARKLSAEGLKSTQKESANPVVSMHTSKQRGVSDLHSLERLVAEPILFEKMVAEPALFEKLVAHPILKELNKTTFTMNTSGGLTSPKDVTGCGPNRDPFKRKKKNAQSDRNRATAKKRPGQNPDNTRTLPCNNSATTRRFSPMVLVSSDTSKGSNKGDQLVPTAEDGVSSETQALQELAEIEGLLTMFEDSGSKNRPEAQHSKESTPDYNSDRADKESTAAKKDYDLDRVEKESTTSKKDYDSNWAESVLGDINEIEGKYNIVKWHYLFKTADPGCHYAPKEDR